MLKICICEDILKFRKELCHFLEVYSFQRDIDLFVEEFSTPTGLINSALNYNIIFLDIGFNGQAQGIDIARELRKKGCRSTIVFVTSYPEYAIEGYEAEAFRYLVKPVTAEQIKSVMDSIITKWKQEGHYIRIKSTDDVRVLDSSSILFIETAGKKRRVHHEGGEFDTWETLYSMLDRLPRLSFAYPSKSHIINLEKVEQIKPKSVILTSGSNVPLARFYKKQFTDKLNDFIKSRHRK